MFKVAKRLDVCDISNSRDSSRLNVFSVEFVYPKVICI